MAQLLLPSFLLFFLLHSPTTAANPFLVAGLTRVVARLIIREGRKIAERKFIKEVTSNTNQDGSSASGLQARLRWNNDDLEYVAELAIGTPARNISLVIDTADSFVWTDCEPCTGCFQQRLTPLAYNSDQSSTFSTIPCNSPQCRQVSDLSTCTQSCQYNASWIYGVLANDTFRFQGGSTDDPPTNITFGCNKVDQFNLSDSSGFAGLGRGPLSLISQLPYIKFSYCFPNAFNDSMSSYIFFGSYADLESIAVSTTPFVKNFNNYYLDLRGISVGETVLPIDPAIFEYVEGVPSSGTIIDTTSPISFLVKDAYDAVRKAFIDQLTDLIEHEQSMEDYGFDLCFDVPSDRTDTQVPNMTFHFSGANMTLPIRNFLIRNDDTTLVCLTMMPTNESYSTLGNLQQQNLQFIYDLQNETLSFRSIQCDQLLPHESKAVKFYLNASPFFALISYIYMFMF